MNRGHGNRWDRDSIIAAMRAHHDTHGHAPRADEWKLGGDHPSYGTVRRFFGSWGAAIRAAGVGSGRRGDFRLDAHGRRPYYVEKFVVQWTRDTSTRTVSTLKEAQQKALLDPALRDLVIDQLRQDCPRAFPQIVRDDLKTPARELEFETPVEDGFEYWLIPVLDWRREIEEAA